MPTPSGGEIVDAVMHDVSVRGGDGGTTLTMRRRRAASS
jgi:hypothetical protein